jgi:lipoic acid synthetase
MKRNTKYEIRNTNLPPWIRAKAGCGEEFTRMKDLVKSRGLNSVCVEASCPNRGECWKSGHVTFLILGDICTRGCLFCNVSGGEPGDVDADEAGRIAGAAKKIKAKYAVITSVTRDDLEDRGAGQFIKTVLAIKEASPATRVELLIPDLAGDDELLRSIAFSGAEVIGHNIEMPERLYGRIRPGADYRTSLKALKILSSMKGEGAGILVKSSMIIGLGEDENEIESTLKDLKEAGVDIVYIGQYLSPTEDHWPVKKYYTPEEFEIFERKALEMGFRFVKAGPLVRSSYRAYEAYGEVMRNA